MAADAGGEFFSLDPEEVAIAFGVPASQSRAKVAFRAVLAIPQLVVLAVFGLVAVLLAVAGWFAALVLGRLPLQIAEYEAGWVAYQARVKAYLYFILDDYPPFGIGPADYPIRVDVGASRLSRVKVLFRWLLVIPAAVVAAVATTGLLIFSPILWIVTLVLGRTPQPLFGAAAAVIRYEARYYGYLFLVTDEYPRRLFGDWETEWSEDDVRLRLSEGSKRWLVLIVILGVAGTIANVVFRYEVRPRETPFHAAFAPLQRASEDFTAEVSACRQSPDRLLCFEHASGVWGAAYDQFGSDMSRISFARSQQPAAAVVVHDAHDVGHALLVVSKAKNADAYTVAYGKFETRFRRLDRDMHALLQSGAS